MLTSASVIWGYSPNENPSRNTIQVAQVGWQQVSVSLFLFFFFLIFIYLLGFPSWLSGKESVNAEDSGLVLGLGRSPGEGNGNLLQWSCVENAMDRGAWRATVHGVTKRWTWLSTWAHLSVWLRQVSAEAPWDLCCMWDRSLSYTDSLQLQYQGLVAPRAVRSQFPDQGSNMRPLYWKAHYWTTGKSQVTFVAEFPWPPACQSSRVLLKTLVPRLRSPFPEAESLGMGPSN